MKFTLAAGLVSVAFLAGCSQNRGPATTGTVAQPPAIRVSGAPGEIPAGTSLEIRTNEAINSRTATAGKTFQAEMLLDVVGSTGAVLVPKGSPAELVLLEIREKGGIKGAGVELGLQSLSVRGTRYRVVSGEVSRSSGLGTNRETAKIVGGGAALGTLIGAAAAGGKGAVIGGLVGAAAAAAIQALTQGKEVNIPAESVMTFRLDEAMKLEPTP